MVFSFVISPPSFKSLFSFYWRLCLSILSSQGAPCTFKNVAAASAAGRFLKNQGLEFKVAMLDVLGFSWPRFGWFWGSLGGSFCVFWSSRWHPEFSKLFRWPPLSPHLGPQGASNSPQELPRRPHGEADGPTKPPRPIWRRFWAYFWWFWYRNQWRKSKQVT